MDRDDLIKILNGLKPLDPYYFLKEYAELNNKEFNYALYNNISIMPQVIQGTINSILEEYKRKYNITELSYKDKPIKFY